MLLSTENASSGINLIPFREITRYTIGSKLFFYNVIGNIALFIPFGYFVSDKIKAKKTHQIILPFYFLVLTLHSQKARCHSSVGRAKD